MNMFTNLDYKMAHPFQDNERVKEVHEKIEELLKKERPNPEDFRGIVADEEIDRDINDVKKLETEWAGRMSEELLEIKRKADIAEYIIYKNLGTWMNQKATPLIAAKADDYLRGIDLVIEKNETEEGTEDIRHLGVGIDIALISKNGTSDAFEKKKKKIRTILKSGKLNEARYISGGSYEGSIKNLPYIILSINSVHVEDLFSGVLKNHSTQKEENHILKHIVAYQIVRQLGVYYQTAERIGQYQLAREYALANNLAYECFGHLIEGLDDPVLWGKVAQDIGVQEMEQFCEELGQL